MPRHAGPLLLSLDDFDEENQSPNISNQMASRSTLNANNQQVDGNQTVSSIVTSVHKDSISSNAVMNFDRRITPTATAQYIQSFTEKSKHSRPVPDLLPVVVLQQSVSTLVNVNSGGLEKSAFVIFGSS